VRRTLTVTVFLIGICVGPLPALTAITCGEPRGWHVEFTSEGPRRIEDGITGVRPTFVHDLSDPSKLLVLFPGTTLLNPALRTSPVYDNATKAVVVFNNDEQLTAIEVLRDEVWTYTFFRRRAAGVFLRSSHFLGAAFGAVYHAKCYVSER